MKSLVVRPLRGRVAAAHRGVDDRVLDAEPVAEARVQDHAAILPERSGSRRRRTETSADRAASEREAVQADRSVRERVRPFDM